ncbi:hypothetical protein ACFY00_38110 [Kitasatospora sp. NPDC001540]|uniref:hypothetical protein n=1 Tax=Kitasatospora sp. NPDC001540 TaxID=3364014 RepID=UPI00368D1875
MAVHSRLAVLGAGTALGTVLVLGTAPAAWACDERPPTTATPTPAQSSAAPAPAPSPSASGTDSATAAPSAVRSAPAASLALLPGADRTLVAGGAPVEFTAQIDNTGTAALEDAAPLPALRNDAAQNPQQALRADELLLQVKTSAGWEALPLSVGCDRSLRGGDLPTTDLAPGGSARYTFRLSVTADAAAQQVDVRLGLRSGSVDTSAPAPHTTLRVTHPAAPAPVPAQPSAAEPAPASASAVPRPRTEVLGVEALPAPARSGTPTPPASDTGALAAASLPSPADSGRPPTSLLVSGVVLIALGAAGFTLVLVHRPARHR